jgi:hypothetical protein
VKIYHKDGHVIHETLDANLRVADLTGADLTGADLTNATGLPDGIAIPRLDSKILEALNNGGTLNMGAWHTCETTHCRAGWAITLAGDAGRALEAKTSSYLAGWLIYRASYPNAEPPDFFASNDDALGDIKQRAKKESQS